MRRALLPLWSVFWLWALHWPGAALAKSSSKEQPLPVVVAGVGDENVLLRRAIRDLERFPISLQLLAPPNRPASAPTEIADLEGKLGTARQAYINADFAGCVSGLESESLVTTLLGAGRRDVVARLLFWQVACYAADGKDEAARRAAEHLARFELPTPTDIDAATPDIELLLASARQSAGARKRQPFQVTSRPAGAEVSINGVARQCFTPCTLALAPGEHALSLTADGYRMQSTAILVQRGGKPLHLNLEEASPEHAAEQWTRRYGGSSVADHAAAMRLLAQAIRSPRFVLMWVEREGNGLRMRATLSVDGRVRARSERFTRDDLAGSAEPLLKSLLVRGELLADDKPLVRRPAFWITLGVTAAVAAGVTAFVVSDPDRQTTLGF